MMSLGLLTTVILIVSGNSQPKNPVSGQAPASDQNRSLVLVGAKIYPSPTERPIPNGVVVIENGRITAVGEKGKIKIPDRLKKLDCAGLTLTAGFWNSHVHLGETKWEDAANIPAAELSQQLTDMAIRYGFTSVFDTGSVLANTKIIRQRIESGEIGGPAILTTGPINYPKGGTPPAFLVQALGFSVAIIQEVTDPLQAATLVDKEFSDGADAIKIYAATWGVLQGTKIPVEVIRAITAEAHKRGKLVLAHPSNADGLKNSIDGGVDVLLHTAPDSNKWDNVLVTRMKAKGIALVPTLKLFRYEGRHSRASFAEIEVNKAVEQLRVYSRVGGTILFGTDVGYMDDYDPTLEYVLMGRAGLNFRQILASLTTAPAERFGASGQTGRIAVGMNADLVLLGGDPAGDLEAFSKVKYTLRHGKIIYQSR